MQTVQFSFYNLADAATLSGGSWLGGTPLANLQSLLLSQVARSADALAASTRIDVDLAVATKSVRLVALARHNCSLAATYRITAGTTSGGSDLYDSGTLDVWPAVYLPEDLEWEDDNFWTGQITAEEAEGYPISLVHDCGENIRARYWRVQITDTANAAGYVELSRLWLGAIWQPAISFSEGVRFGWESRSVAEYSLGGVKFSEERPPARILGMALEHLSDAEALGQVLDAQRRLGTTGQLWVVPDADDAARRFKRDFLATMRKYDPIAAHASGWNSTAIELEEVL
jgi:hypothetical protein